MSFSATDPGTIGIMIVGLAAVIVIISLAVVSLISHRRQVRS
jgi:DMSO/TMAO reductase YedYZ heme-binding membrane subunit